MKYLLLATLAMLGCSHSRPTIKYTPAPPEVSCVTITVHEYSTAIFTGEDNKTGVGLTCDEAYRNYKEFDKQ
jgi:hypothetical protein